MNSSSNDDIQLCLNKTWISLNAWMDMEENIETFFNENYIEYNNGWNGGTSFLCIPYDEEYRLYYGQPYPQERATKDKIRIDEFKDYLEIMYARWIKTEQHYNFTVEINNMFDKFRLPYKLCSGKLLSKGYRTTETIEKILNKKMFERKIAYSEEMIMSNETLDKKIALDYIVDALQYYLSVQNADNTDKKYASAAEAVCSNQDSKVYSVVKNEIREVMKLSNEYFDIRHNEYLNKARERREVLEDKQFIEYLYNRVYALLYLLRLKIKSEAMITGKRQ